MEKEPTWEDQRRELEEHEAITRQDVAKEDQERAEHEADKHDWEQAQASIEAKAGDQKSEALLDNLEAKEHEHDVADWTQQKRQETRDLN